jgi:carboxymethylenebutenolidase
VKLPIAVLAASLAVLPASRVVAQNPHAGHDMAPAPTNQKAVPSDPSLPPGEAQAKAALDHSPRHGEYTEVKVPGADKPVRTWVVYPERRDKAPVVIVIHEIFGLSDWIRAVADQFASAGFIAVAPDLISGKGPGGGGTEAVPSRDDVVKLVTSLSKDEVVQRLNAVRDYATKLPSASGKSAAVGFCWGGTTSFSYATVQPALAAAVVYYGTAPDAQALAALEVPVLGLYGGDDARVTSTVEPTKVEMQKLGKTYEAQIYQGAGHGFLRQQDGREGANLAAARDAWPRTLAFIRKYTGK